ncbi:pyruvate, water dikinase [Desulfonauticus submarinus]|uniref:Phosphoenolpyruvate synthase n=1 Tax=Desulfonauticus submarinus TaxID=206665 RepID=A0A1H0FGP7_9BACT|nr:PEP/pyruvate-binding domain-containing protein [Desulfonauticus submarinus]SDN93776.1 pyruvate, water dikinase [Desulfonauticus submarinus]
MDWLKKFYFLLKAKVFPLTASLKYKHFRELLLWDRRSLESIAQIEEIILKKIPCDFYFLSLKIDEVKKYVKQTIECLIQINPQYIILREYFKKVCFYLDLNLKFAFPSPELPFVLPLYQAKNSFLCGGKASSLSKILELDIKINILPGFVITTQAFSFFLKENDLISFIRLQLSSLDNNDFSKIKKISSEIQEKILNSPVPDKLKQEVEHALKNLKFSKFAFRSSAHLEDSCFSFAGQYKSCLNVEKNKWEEAYKQVLASKYAPSAITYRLKSHLPDTMTPMAVLVMPMLSPEKSGVMYTSLPENRANLGIFYVSGIGENLVGGEQKGDKIILEKKYNKKIELLDKGIKTLFKWGLALENILQHPLDIEWAIQDSRVYLLQVRPFMFFEHSSKEIDLPVLTEGSGVSFGFGCGSIFVLNSLKDIEKVPAKSIVWTKYLYPELTLILDKVSGIIAKEGSLASHFSHIAREIAKPVLTGITLDELPLNGQVVSIDGQTGKVFLGKIKINESIKSTPFECKSAETLNKILTHLSKLNLVTTDENFVPENCRSLHDLVRYCHEMAIKEMFYLQPSNRKRVVKQLKTSLPLSIFIFNLGSAWEKFKKDKKYINLEDIKSTPFQYLFKGFLNSAVSWGNTPPNFDWDKFDDLSAGIFNPKNAIELNSFCLLDKDYMHFMLRFGYHFTLIDALVSDITEQNYVQVSFKGGGGLEIGKNLRLKLISFVFRKMHFQIKREGDFLKATLRSRTKDELKMILELLGILFGLTRMLDMHLNFSNYKNYVHTFLNLLKEYGF